VTSDAVRRGARMLGWRCPTVKWLTTHAGAVAGVLLCLACDQKAPPLNAGARIAVSRVAVLIRTGADLDSDGTIEGWSALALDANHVAFLDYVRERVVVVDSAGGVTATFGRHGGGPGEFQNPRFLVHTESGLGVVDGLKHTVVTFSVDGRPQKQLPLQSVVGIPSGILTGIARLENDTWVFSVREKTPTTYREALYARAGGTTRLLASTPVAEARRLRLPCGITLSPEPPVFWPTLRWSASSTRVAYAATTAARVVIWDAVNNDSTIVFSPATSPRATEEAALALPLGLEVQMGSRKCRLTAQDALRQRGMERVIPPIDRVTLSPTGVLWVRLVPSREGHLSIRIHTAATTDTLVTGAFPAFFVANGRYVAEEQDSTGHTVASLWDVQRRR
jgi:hypothetical protein